MIKNHDGVLVDGPTVEREAMQYCKENALGVKLTREVVFVSRAFCDYFMNCQFSKKVYDLNTVADLFEDNVSSQAEAAGIGLKPVARTLYRMVPSIKKLFDLEAALEKKRYEEMEKKLEGFDDVKELKESLKAREKGIKRAEEKVKELEAKADREIERAKNGYYSPHYSSGRC